MLQTANFIFLMESARTKVLEIYGNSHLRRVNIYEDSKLIFDCFSFILTVYFPHVCISSVNLNCGFKLRKCVALRLKTSRSLLNKLLPIKFGERTCDLVYAVDASVIELEL